MSVQKDPKTLLREALRKKNISVESDAYDLKNLSVSKPALFIANQALEDVDELVLMDLLASKELPFKIITRKKKAKGQLSNYSLHLDFSLLQWEDYVKAIFKNLKQAKENGFSLCLILHFTDRALDTLIREQFLNQLMKAVMRAEIPVVPIRLKAPFPGFIRPALGSKLILRPRKEPYQVTARVGNVISVEEQQKFLKAADFRRFIQSKIFSLGSGLEVKPLFFRRFFQKPEEQEPIIDPIDPPLIEAEIKQLKFDRLIASQGEFDIFVVQAKDIPNALKEIGRLRELTFRTVGEGTGKSIDLDEYDIYYRQLILWDREAKQIAGGYRMGLGEEIFNRYGAKGFYINAMFKIKDGFYPTMKQSVELGRSYIIPSYQKKRLPLFLLWKGILFFLLQNPNYRYLYGPVSISKYYSSLSRGLIVAFIKKHYYDEGLAQYLAPRKPFKARMDKVDIDSLAGHLDQELHALDNLIEDIEPSHIRIPVLVRQYLKLNARFISFNVDPNFSDVLDGFIILDLHNVPYEMIEALRKESSV